MTESTENEPDDLLKVPPAQQRTGESPEDLIKATEQSGTNGKKAMKERDPDNDE
jgi:hypothetical protein